MTQRGSGILLHITSLPSPRGIGDLGPAAYRFVDLLHDAGQKYWQVLPLTPTRAADDNSPYMSSSAFAANTQLISPDLMERDGLLDPDWKEHLPVFPENRTGFDGVRSWKKDLFGAAFAQSRDAIIQSPEYCEFCTDQGWWLEDFALFQALSDQYGSLPWNRWPDDVRNREPGALETAASQLREGVLLEKFLQFVFFMQWEELHAYCRQRGVAVIGDLPLYVSFQSADVWANPALFRLDSDLNPAAVAGVPPDYFSPAGQLWTNPLYQWDEHERTGFSWWIRRLRRNIALFDRVRIDHFRGLVAYWEVLPHARDATAGQWVSAPADRLLETLKMNFPAFPFIAEDLGVITTDVTAIIGKYHLCGMRVLQFAFTDDKEDNPHNPGKLSKNIVLYTGTHDNAPVRGWIGDPAASCERKRIERFFGLEYRAEDLPDVFIRVAMESVADTVIIPVQDILCLGSEARMNTPGTDRGNWQWRMTYEQMANIDTGRLRGLVNRTGRV